MNDGLSPLLLAEGFGLALALGFLIGWTREPDPGAPPRPGIRDFLIIAALGAACAYEADRGLTVAAFAGTSAILIVMRVQRPERAGITTELAALLTFLVGYMALTPARALAAGIGIVAAAILATKGQIRSFARDVFSDSEYLDTLAFLSLIFIIFPILPRGGYGPFGFFDARKIWVFVILVSGVDYVGYFFTKFLDPRRGALLTAVAGGLASSTAYTGAAAHVVAETPGSAVPMARATLIANAILFPRMLILAGALSLDSALAGIPSMGAMTAVGIAAAFALTRNGWHAASGDATAGFRNPFSLLPALRYGTVFALILFLVQAGKHYFGSQGQLVTAAIGGLIDCNAVTVSLAQFQVAGTTTIPEVVLGMVVSAAANAVFKWGLAETSHCAAFWARVGAGFVITFAVGGAVLYFLGVPQLQLPG
jgi:uncharacterized membrane protein (DUF4010 family)